MSNSNEEIESAKFYMERADKKMKMGGCGCFGDSMTTKAEQAIELYTRATVILKREKEWNLAGKCFEEIAFIQERLGKDNTESYQEASHCYSFEKPDESRKVMEKCVRIYENRGDFASAANIYRQMAEHFEDEKKFDLAISNYSLAADRYMSVTAYKVKSNEYQCRLKAADLMCITGHKDSFQDATDIYVRIGKQYLHEQLLRLSAKELFFKVVMLYLLYDVGLFT